MASGAGAALAAQMVEDMTAAIGKNHERFSEPRPLELDGVMVYRTEGQGLVNFYDVKGRNVYEFSIDGADPEGLIRRLVQDF